MLIQTGASGFIHPHGSEITPEGVYLRRRELLQWATLGGMGVASGAAFAKADTPDALAPLRALLIASATAAVFAVFASSKESRLELIPEAYGQVAGVAIPAAVAQAFRTPRTPSASALM